MADLKRMLAGVRKSITSNTPPVGFQVAIYDGTELRLSHGEGYAVVPGGSDSGRKMTTHVRTDVGSISKTITAATVVRALLSSDKVHRDSSVEPFLPPDWKRGPNVSKLTFRMLLTHSGGFTAPGPFDSLVKNIADGLPAKLPTAQSNYNNGNYDMFRIILPRLLYPNAVKQPMANPQLRYGELFLKACHQLVLDPCGVPSVNVWGSGEQPFARYYSNDRTEFAMPASQDFSTRHAGAGFWFISSREYGRVIANLRAGKAGANVWGWMKEIDGPGDWYKAGMYKVKGKHGAYYGHNGGFGASDEPAIRSGWLAFPGGVTGVVTMNSAGPFDNSPGSFRDPVDVLAQAYDSA